MSPPQRKRPTPKDRPSPKSMAADYTQSSAGRRQDGYAAPTAGERAERKAFELLTNAGYRLTIRCLTCGRWLADPESVRLYRGPVCRQRAEVAQ